MPVFAGHPGFGEAGVVLVQVVTDVVPAGPHRRHRGCTRTSERVEDEVSPVGIKLYQPRRQFDRERGRVPDAGGTFGRDLPYVESVLHEVLASHRRLGREVVAGALAG